MSIINRHNTAAGNDLLKTAEHVLVEQQLTFNEFMQSIKLYVSELVDTDNEDFVQSVLFFCHMLDSPDKHLDILQTLLMNPNHFQHGEIIRILQDVGSEKSISYLLEAIALKPALSYLDYDDYGAYYKKCLWALTAIGTEEAKVVISFFTGSPVPELWEQAV